MPLARTEAVDMGRGMKKSGVTRVEGTHVIEGGDIVKIASISDFSESWHIDENTKWFNFSFHPIHLGWKVYIYTPIYIESEENPKEFLTPLVDLHRTEKHKTLAGSTPIWRSQILHLMIQVKSCSGPDITFFDIIFFFQIFYYIYDFY